MDYQTIIIGAGISGIGSAILFDKNDMGSYTILESSDNIGGTWRSNTYPGVAVDIPSFAYQFSFEPNFSWSQMYAKGSEINDYVHFCADKYNIKKHIQFNTKVKSAEFNKESNTWSVLLESGKTLVSRYIVAATGIFHEAILPNIPGRDEFKGHTTHPSNWDHDYDYTGKKVAIIGTGASAVQIIPSLAPDVEKFTVFQRTPIWVAPRDDFKISEEKQKSYAAEPSSYFKVEKRVRKFLNNLWLAMLLAPKIPFSHLVSSLPQRWFLHQEIKDPVLRKKLTPNYAYGCKRPATSNDYLKAFTRDNVDLVTCGIERITEKGIVTKEGKEVEVDFLIYSTGYQATKKGNFPNFKIHGTDSELSDFWEAEGYQSYNGVSVPGFPNMFLTSGPFSFGLNWYDQLESNIHLTIRVMKEAQKNNATLIGLDRERHDKHYQVALKKASQSLQLSRPCTGSNSYYVDARGENSLPAVITPKQRDKKVKNMDLGGFVFSK